MRAGTAQMAGLLADEVDFSRSGAVVDVGGGDGTLLAAVLCAHPQLRGTVYDSVEGSAQAPATIETAGLGRRCTVETGDFFDRVPAGGDTYLLKSIVHDWDDERAATILRHCCDALLEGRPPTGGRVLVAEPVLPDTVTPGDSPGRYLSDLNMLVNVGGRERTRDDFAALFRSAGLVLTDVVELPAHTGFCVLEAAPV
ncbi:MAG: methyltransferase, partial [Pseudonocardia sediminis]